MSAQHTPAPWNDGLHYQEHLAIQSDNGRLVAFCGAMARDDEQLENLANARLIAAAPDLLHALQMIDSNAAESVEWIRRVARAAIAKATGGAA